MNKFGQILTGGALLALAGCWTFNETPYPHVALTRAEGSSTNLTLSVAGFETVLTEYEAIHGYRTVYVPGYYGRHHYEPGYFEAVPSVALVPQHRTTDMFLRRAQDQLEGAGFALSVNGPSDRIVEVRFEGPFVSSGDETKKLAWEFGTIFFCDYAKARWTAKLRIRDSKTGRLVFTHDYEQTYETNVFGLIPLFSIGAAEETNSAFIQSWCLAALTDRAVADATSYLAAGR